MAPLAKVARIRMRFDPAMRRTLSLAADLERANGADTPALDGKVRIQWQDGLPPDPREQAETEELRVRSGTTSRAAAIRRLDGGSLEDAQVELSRALQEPEVNRAPIRSAGE